MQYDLPSDVTSAPSLTVFGRRLKTELFRRCYNATTLPDCFWLLKWSLKWTFYLGHSKYHVWWWWWWWWWRSSWWVGRRVLWAISDAAVWCRSTCARPLSDLAYHYRTYVYQSHQFPLASLSALQLVWRPRRPSHQTSSWQSGILGRWSCGVEQSADRHSICTNTLQSAPSRIDSRLICFYSRILYFESHQLNSSSICCTVVPLYCLYGHVTAPYKLSYYYYYYVNCTMCVACCRAYRRDLYDIDEDSQDYERRILPAPLPPRSAHVHFRLALRYTV